MDNIAEDKKDIACAHMSEDEKIACEKIIFSHIDKGEIVGDLPLPGTGVVADVGTMVTMTLSMAKVFHVPLTPDLAKNIVICAAQNVAGGYMAKKLMKDAVKFIPLVGKITASFIGPQISRAMLTMVGWDIAETLSREKELSISRKT